MKADKKIISILMNAENGKSITKDEAINLLKLPENSLESSILTSTANIVSRQKFSNHALLLGQIGVDMAPCDGDCAFCFFANSNALIKPSALDKQEIIDRCIQFVLGGAQGVFLMTMHRFGLDWFRDLCADLRNLIPNQFEILANVGDLSLSQLKELKDAGVTGAYHVSRLREGTDSCISPDSRKKTIEYILEAGLSWFNMCEPVGPEHTPEELAEQIWIGIDYPCVQHGVMQRFPVKGSPLYKYGQVSLSRLNQIIAVVALATQNKPNIKSIAVNAPSVAGLFSGANAFFPETGEPIHGDPENHPVKDKEGFTTALWRDNDEITTCDCRKMMVSAGFSHLMDFNGYSKLKLQSKSYSKEEII
ncbi:MAG: hypothetical protein JXK07_04970 [Spirochaetes bacterium]|nr:hypothetical protein [Spirochaetota bacterium]